MKFLHLLVLVSSLAMRIVFAEDYFLTTDIHGELAPGEGYTSQGVVFYAANTQLASTIPMYRWYKPSAPQNHVCLRPSCKLNSWD